MPAVFFIALGSDKNVNMQRPSCKKVVDGLLQEYVAVDVSRKPGRPSASPAAYYRGSTVPAMKPEAIDPGEYRCIMAILRPTFINCDMPDGSTKRVRYTYIV